MGSEPGPGQPVRLGGRLFTGTDLAVVAIARQVPGSYPDGADVIEIDGGPGIVPVIREARERHPELAVAVRTGSAEVADRAAAAGAGVICADPDAAVAAGVRRDGIVADAGPDLDAAAIRRTEALSAAGWPVLVTLPDGNVDAALAAAVVAAQHGARFFRTDRVLETRQALDMLATIRGDRPPAAARRGLA